MRVGHIVSRLRNSLAHRVKRAFGRRDERGTVLVEFAVTLPLLMTVLTGTASFSVALYWMQQLENTTSAAALSLGDDAGLTTDPCSFAVTAVTGALPNMSPSKFTYTLTVSYPNSSGTLVSTSYGPTTGSSFSCSGGASLMTANYPVTLTVSYAYSWLPILKFVPSSGLTATGAAQAE
jgi:Flp pilus assembly protein TadG